tara:strand:- start:658 stop:1389 length:732 start_codon:yes stop_codon:yes gene_type:complete
MSNYSKTTDFAAKDALTTGNANKIVKGTEIDDEFEAIQTAVNTKADKNNTALTGVPTAPTATFGADNTQISTTAFVQAAMSAVYPVGSIYSNAAVATNPATLLGFGTWEAYAAGRVLVGLDSGNAIFDTVGETGGTADQTNVTHTHDFAVNSAEEAAHTHFTHNGDASSTTMTDSNYPARSFDPSSRSATVNTASSTVANIGLTSAGTAHIHVVSGTTDSQGSSATNANLQPYITVYMWKRTA